MKLLGSTLFTLATALLLGAFFYGFSTCDSRIAALGIISSIGIYMLAVISICVSDASESYISIFSRFCHAFVAVLITGTILMFTFGLLNFG